MPAIKGYSNSLGLNTTPTRPVIQTGRVLYSNPKLGYYEILPDSTINGVDGTIQAIDTRSYPIFGSGVSVNTPYPTGTPVLFFTFDRNNGEPVPRHEAVIIGADKLYPIKGDYRYPPFTLGNDSLSIFDNTDLVQNVYLNIQNNNLVKNRSYNTAQDLCDGDFAVTGTLKNGLYTGYGITSVSGSYNNNLMFFTESNGCVFSTGNYYINDSILGREETYADYDGQATYVKQFAYDIGESYGAVGYYSAFKEGKKDGEQIFDIQAVGQFPVYRYQELAGAICSGKAISVSNYETDIHFNATNQEKDILKAGILNRNEKAKADDIIQYGLSTIRMPWDGSVAVNSLRSISLDKDYFIPYATQVATESNTDLEDPANEDKPLEDTYSGIKGNLAEYVTQGASALYEYSKLGVVRRFFSNVLKRTKAWKIRTFEEVSKTLGIAEKALATLGFGPPCYVSNATALKDPVANKASLIDALSAFIHIAPSGAVVISDGHGAEIRLEGGNITISPAGDLKILPGRDVIGIVPGRTELVSKGRIDIASDQEVVTVKAEREAQIISQNGVVSLESLSQTPITYVSDKEDDLVKWTGAGVVIKSARDLVINGKCVSLRCQEQGDNSDGRNDIDNGAIIIDSNNSPLLLYGKNIAARGTDSIVMAGSDGSAMSLANDLEFAASSINLPGSVSVGGSSNLTVRVPSISKDGVKEDQLSIRSIKGGLTVLGNAVITDAVEAVAASFESLGAQRARIVNGAIDNASLLSGIKTPKDAAQLENPVPAIKLIKSLIETSGTRVLSNTWGNITTEILAIMSSDMYKAKTSSVISLYYPTTEQYFATEFFIVKSRWQRLLAEDTGWGKPNLVNNTMIFPGKEKWVKDKCVYEIVADGYSKAYTYNDIFNVNKAGSYSMNPLGPISEKYNVNC